MPRNFAFENQMEITFTSPGWLSESFFQERGMETPSCGAALSNMAVTPDGKAVACQSCLDREILGDMLLDDWKKIWKNPKCRRYREYAAKMFKKCPLWRRKYMRTENRWIKSCLRVLLLCLCFFVFGQMQEPKSSLLTRSRGNLFAGTRDDGSLDITYEIDWKVSR